MRVSIRDIQIEDRQRKNYGDLYVLADSLNRLGMLNPILVEETPNADKPYKLVAGERRLKAAILAGWLKVPITTVKDCSDVTRKEMELEENIRRKDFLWSEEVALKLEIDELKRAQHGSGVSGRYSDGEGWKNKDTAMLLNESVGTISQDLNLARAIRNDPTLLKDLQKLPKKVAYKKLKHIQEARRLEKTTSAFVESENLIFEHSSCADFLPKVADNSIQLIITDPPYAVSTIEEVTGDYADLTQEHDNATESYMETLYKEIFPHLYRVLDDGGHMYIFFGNEWYPFLTTLLTETGFIYDPVPLIWYKQRTTTPNNGYNYAQTYEPILYCKKPPKNGRQLNIHSGNLLMYKPIGRGDARHVFHKPPELIDFLVKTSSHVGHSVLDPFAGSGQILKSALSLKRKAYGCEFNQTHYARACEYLKETKDD